MDEHKLMSVLKMIQCGFHRLKWLNCSKLTEHQLYAILTTFIK